MIFWILVVNALLNAVDVPSDILEYDRLERCHNCFIAGMRPPGAPNIDAFPITKLPALSKNAAQPERIWYWLVPRRLIGDQNIFTSKYTDAALQNLTQLQGQEGEPLVRVFAAESHKEDVEQWTRLFGRKPDGNYWGNQIQGRSTYHMWDEANRSGKKWFIKFALKMEDEGKVVRALGRKTIERAIRMNDIVEEILRTEGKHGIVGVLPERFGLFYENYGFIIRETDVVGLEFNPGAAFIAPMHGLLSDEKYTFVGLTSNYKPIPENVDGPTFWYVNEFYPQLARALVQLIYYHGFIPELHTQNIKFILEMDPKTHVPTGKILGFAIVDATDFAIDPSIRLLMGKYAYMDELTLMESPSIMGNNVMGEKYLADHAAHFLAFLSQALGSTFFLSLPKHPRVFEFMKKKDLEDREAGLYQVFLSHLLNYMQYASTQLGFGFNPELVQLQEKLLQQSILSPTANKGYEVVVAPSIRKYLATLDNSGQSPGQIILRITASFIKMVAREHVQVRLMTLIPPKKKINETGKARQQKREVENDNRNRLRGKFLEALSYRRVAFLEPHYSVDPSQWIYQDDMDYYEVPHVGVVAFKRFKKHGKEYPIIYGIALSSGPNNATLCSDLLLEQQSLVYSNQHIPEMKKLADFLMGWKPR